MPSAHTSAKLSPRIIANAAACLADPRISIGNLRASATDYYELLFLIALSLVAALVAAER